MSKREFELGEAVSYEDPDVPGQESGYVYEIDGDDITIEIVGESEPRQVTVDRSWVF